MAIFNFVTGEMQQMIAISEGMQRIEFLMPTRGMVGFRNLMMSTTRGTAIVNTLFAKFAPLNSELNLREAGAMVSSETGQVTTYALEDL